MTDRSFRPAGDLDHLILLTGSNPLPNVVALYHLLKERGTAHLVATDETMAVAQRADSWLAASNVETRIVRVDRRRSDSIQEAVGAIIDSTFDDESVGLHYTGGTKAMAVHAAAAYLSCCAGEHIPPHISYLDAASQELVIEAHGSSSVRYAGLEPRLSLNDLVRLHGWRASSRTPLADERRSMVARDLGRINAGGHGNSYGSWKKEWEGAWSDSHRKGYNRSSLNALATIRIKPFPDGPAFESIRRLLGLEGASTVTMGDITQAMGCFEDAGRCAHWLHGLWLETLVESSLQEVAESQKLHEIHANVNVRAAGTGTDVDFELDVAAMRGSQLLAFSCSSDSGKKRLKLKLFEMQMRARQMGGDQACVCLVSTVDDPTSLQAEARSVLRSSRLLVIGRQDLEPERLTQRLDQWISDQKGSAP
jgi:hypothetical protein